MNQHLQEDTVTGKAYDSQLVKRLFRYVWPYRKHLFISLIALFLFTGIEIFSSVYLYKVVIDKYIQQGLKEGLTILAIAYLLLLLCALFFQFIEFYLVNLMSQRTMYDLRLHLFRHLEKMSLSFFNKRPVGSLMTRLTSDIEALDAMFSNCIVFIFNDILIIVGLLGIMIYLSPSLTLVTMIVLPIIFWISARFKKKVRLFYRDVRNLLSKMNGFLQENISGMETSQVFGRLRKNYEQFSSIVREYRDANIRGISNYAFFFPAVEFLGSLAIALLLWFGGGWINEPNSALTLGTLVAFIQASQKFFQPIRDLADKFNILQTAMAAGERVFTLLDMDETIKPAGQPLQHAIRGEIEFRNVWFAYNEEEWVLRDVSFKVQKGKRIAIVGATGSGKSTIINLLFRFYDVQKGQIFIDGIDIKQYDLKNLREQMGLVLQDVFLFSGDLAGNIGLQRPGITMEKIKEVAQVVQIDHYIEKLPNQYQTEVKERGATLSLGQRQLLSFARALAIDPRIFVLDEATSNVDTETEHLIQEALEKIIKNRTCIIVAHRLSTIKQVDEILVLHKGEIVERGSHRELLEEQGHYYRLYQLQYKDQLETEIEEVAS